MKGKIVKKNNVFYVRTISAGKELDEIELEYYPLSLTESNVELVEGKEVWFEVKSVSYVDLEGWGQEDVNWAIVNEKG